MSVRLAPTDGPDRGDAASPGAEGTSPTSRRAVVTSVVGLVVFTGALVPFSHYQLGPTISFLPAMLAVVACFDLITIYFLIGDYRDRGDVRLLMMSMSYVWSLVVMTAYAAAFPGVFSDEPPLAFTPSMAPYFYILWHAGFPVLLGAAWAPWPERWVAPTPDSRRRLLARVAVTVSGVVALGFVAALAAFAHRLPVLINGLDTSRMTTLTSPIALPVVAIALVTAARGTRRRTGPERWVSLAILVCLCDLLLTYTAAYRYSVGWYCGRTLTLVAAAVVLMGMLADFLRLKARAEQDASSDALTGLQNRRSASATLDQLVARCRRSGSPLGVLSVDIDLFKRINDDYGHEAGDEALTTVGRLLVHGCRRGDFVARVGGEEFLVLLPDTDDAGTMVVAEKIRALVAAAAMTSVAESMTVSVGATTLQITDLSSVTLLRRCDIALYQAKAAGRNRVVMAAHAVTDEPISDGLEAIIATTVTAPPRFTR